MSTMYHWTDPPAQADTVPVAKDFLHTLLDHIEGLIAFADGEARDDRPCDLTPQEWKELLDSSGVVAADLYHLVFPDAPESQ